MPKEKGIRIDPERGVNPRLTTCTQCGADTNELALLGVSDHILQCSKCATKVLGIARQRKCPRCRKDTLQHIRRLGEFEKIPMGLCTACQQKQAQADEMVRQGGIFWRCDHCDSTGAIRPGHPLAEAVRKELDIAPPHSAGITFHHDTCPVCSPHSSLAERTNDLK